MEIKKISKLPGLLSNIYKPPLHIYVRGNIPSNVRYITIVGPRNPSIYAQKICIQIIEGLKSHPVCIVSGLAYGIDTLVHKTAVENNIKCIVFPGSGILKGYIYPKINEELSSKIIEKGGALICSWHPKMKPAPWTFVSRNRLMAGISRATIVIEAGEKSGTLITARYALEENRDVYVIPGDIDRDECVGSNRLIQEGAMPITSIEDLLIKLKLKD